jgi:hypothetical protein
MVLIARQNIALHKLAARQTAKGLWLFLRLLGGFAALCF